MQRAIESVLEQVPDLGDEASPEESPKYQPWAETVAPPSKNKRPLAELLAEYEARIAADPDARAGAPAAKHPATAFFERFDQGRKPPGRRRGRSGRRRAAPGAACSPASRTYRSTSAAATRGWVRKSPGVCRPFSPGTDNRRLSAAAAGWSWPGGWPPRATR